MQEKGPEIKNVMSSSCSGQLNDPTRKMNSNTQYAVMDLSSFTCWISGFDIVNIYLPGGIYISRIRF